MRVNLKSRAHIAVAAISLLALALLAPQASAAQKPPTLVSTPEYKAFVQYVAKLRDMKGQAHSPAEKAAFERELTGKHGAAANRAKGLFQQGKQDARAETQARSRTAVKKIRKAEAAELAALRAEYDDKFDAAVQSYQDKLGALEDKFDGRQVDIQRQIRKLRTEKAKAKGLDRKDQIQAQINVLVQELSDSQKDQREAVRKLRDNYKTQKKAIRAAKAADTAEVTEKRGEAVESVRQRWNRAYNTKVADLKDRRTNQLADLEDKLAAGRASIASMPDDNN